LALTVLVLGDNCIDRYLPPVSREFVGGQAANVAAGFAAAGVRTGYAGVVGTDRAGRMVVDELDRRGIDLSAVEIVPGRTGVTTIASEEGERRFIAEEYGVSAPYTVSVVAASLLHEVRLAYAVHVVDVGAVAAELRSGATLALDISTEEEDDAMLGVVDILFASAPGISMAAALTHARELLERGPRMVVITRGPDGAVAIERGRAPVSRPAVQAEIVDTLGAGDALAAGFLAGRLAGATIARALDLGMASAAVACSHLGAMPVA
jgi:fructoselysine 6-kinase